MRASVIFLNTIVFLAAALPLMAQVDPGYVIPKANPFTSSDDVFRGERLFKGQCSRCHGLKGEGGQGAVLARPRLRRAADDESLFVTIRDGIKGTEMPAADTMSSREIWQVAGYVRSLGRLPAESVPGDARRGENLYRTKGNCVQCHVVAGEGGTLGPELTEIGARRGVGQLRSAILNPESAIPEGFLQVRLVTRDDRQVLGVRLNEDTFTIQIRDLNGHLYSFVKANLKDLRKEPGKTPMPSFRQTFSNTELDDLISYLVSLKGRP